jgi:hypothetical protein
MLAGEGTDGELLSRCLSALLHDGQLMEEVGRVIFRPGEQKANSVDPDNDCQER